MNGARIVSATIHTKSKAHKVFSDIAKKQAQ
jgi:hypothetical protein